MLNALNNFEINSMDELKDFIEMAMEGLEEIEILKLSVEDIINISRLHFNSNEDFAYYYSIMKSQSTGLTSYIEVNPNTNKVGVKKEYKLTMNDMTKISLFFKLLNDAYSIDDAKSIINDIDTALYKYFYYKKAQEQLHLYNLALRYGKRAILKIDSIMNFYHMFC